MMIYSAAFGRLPMPCRRAALRCLVALPLVFVAAIAWNSVHQLLLRAERNIEINATVDATGSGSLVLHYNQAGGGGDYLVNAKVGLASTAGFSTQDGGNPALGWTVLTQADLAPPPRPAATSGPWGS